MASDRPATADSGRVIVELVVDDSANAPSVMRAVRAHGGTVVGRAPGLLLAEFPARGRIELTESVGASPPRSVTDSLDAALVGSLADLGATARPPVAVDVRPEVRDRLRQGSSNRFAPEQFGPTTGGADTALNALAWHDAGVTGAGVRVGVIDFFDTMFWDVAEHGPLPVTGVTAQCFDLGSDCTAEFFDSIDLGGERHGVAIVEVIRDVAPDAEIFIGQATTASDYEALVDWFAAKGVDVINRSLGSRYDGPGDGRGPLDEIAAAATARGITWINSGGNNGVNRYYRQPVRLNGTRVAFGPDGDQTFLRMSGCVQLGGVRWANDWDLPPAERTDYDVFLWESPTGDPAAGSIVASSQLRQARGAPPLELLGDDYCPDPGSSMYLEVRWLGGSISGDILEITDYGGGIALHTQSPYSAAVPIVDSDDPGVIAVGAIDPPDGDEIASYSSQGPTNDGRIAPDVTAASGFGSVAFAGTFAGTSASAAAVSGAAALLLDADLAVPGHPLADLIRHLADDRGDAGPDSVYGHGEFVLPDPPDATGVDSRPSTFVPLDVPARVLDTRPDQAIGPPALIGELFNGQLLDMPIVTEAGLPADEITAVAVNIVSVEADRASHVQAMPTDRATLGEFSNLNTDAPDQTRANFAIVPVGADGSISIYSIAEGHIVVDLLGWFRATPAAAAAGRFVELPDAQRVLDSRSSAPVSPLASGEVRAVPMPTGVDPDEVAALVMTVTTTGATDAGWVQAIPAGRNDVVGATSTLNVDAGDTVANAAIVPVGDDGVALTSFFLDDGSADVIVDVTGYITSESATASESGRFVAIRPGRAFDSRLSVGFLFDRSVSTVDARPLDVPSTASGVVWNVTIASAARAGHATGWRADGAEPATSLLNWSNPGTTRASSAITAVDVGRANFRVEDGPVDSPDPLGHLIVDVFGYFT